MSRWMMALALTLLGCGDSGARSDGGDAALADLGATDLYGCQDPDGPDGGSCLTSVSGQIVDEAGAPLDGILVSVCGDACFFGRTAQDGRFVTFIKERLIPSTYAVEVHGRPDRAPFYARLPALTGDTVTLIAPLVLPLLPATGPAIRLDESAQTITEGDVTLELAAGTKLELDVEDVAMLPLGAQLRTLNASAALRTRLAFVDATRPPDLLFGFAPFEVIFSQKARVTFANTAQLPANAAVDVLSQRGLLSGTPPAAGFDRVAGAHVSADGTKIVMDAGEGVTTLTWLALVKK